MSSVLGVEYLTLREVSPVQPDRATYGFDLRPEYVDPARYWVAVFKVSECLGGLIPEPPGWVGQYPAEEYDPVGPAPFSCPFQDDDARPAGSPLRVSVALPYLEPRYGDAWIAFVLARAEVGE